MFWRHWDAYGHPEQRKEVTPCHRAREEGHRVGKLIPFVGVGDHKPQLTVGLTVAEDVALR